MNLSRVGCFLLRSVNDEIKNVTNGVSENYD